MAILCNEEYSLKLLKNQKNQKEIFQYFLNKKISKRKSIHYLIIKFTKKVNLIFIWIINEKFKKKKNVNSNKI